MSDIYEDIRGLLFHPHVNYLNISGGHKIHIENYLAVPNNNNAKKLFTFISELQQKYSLYSLLELLKLYEKQFHDILPNHRDHYKHSANVYLLGLALYNSNRKLRNAIKTFRYDSDDTDRQKDSFLFRWSIASILHDISYPLQMSVEAFNDCSAFFHSEKKRKDLRVKPNILSKFNNISVLNGDGVPDHMKKDSAIGLIANYLLSDIVVGRRSNVDYGDLFRYLAGKIEDDLYNGDFDHGVFSALITLKYINELYKRNADWDIQDFYYDAVDSATAIFLHNFFKYSGLKDILQCESFLCSYPSPLGYLLALCDTFCEWNRGSSTDHKLYRLTVQNQNVIDLQVPPRKHNEIRNAIAFLNEELTINIM